jgi:hypothetical protein
MTKNTTNDTASDAGLAAAHATLLDALAAVDLDIVRLKTQMVASPGEALEPLLGDATRLTGRRAQLLRELAPIEAALIESRRRALEAARDRWVADVAALQAGGHLPNDEEVH